MANTIVIDGQSYDTASLSTHARHLLASIAAVEERLRDEERKLAALETARFVHNAALKSEIVAVRTGVDLRGLLQD
ncbi:hypothetical protein [Rhodovulum adriaticum]|uniref:Uncharacterized protein n=1 Tax=Rhodovulum adriaticum TaxID=35804 RepID=A0A4V2SKM0_RHOAD|nr:hypothetical protein [Rhodovulum adriaticum]MBK1637307.1 hypothetical protein [Rhodovulum adriaticum]TCP19996.1 hypothetical protein EV656_1238 [Rhodovulum adriaticum]